MSSPQLNGRVNLVSRHRHTTDSYDMMQKHTVLMASLDL